MPKIYPIIKKVVQSGGGGSGGGNESLVIKDATGLMTVTVPETETLSTYAEANTFDINATSTEINLLPVEAHQASILSDGDTNAIQTEGRITTIRYWATATVDNDASRTTPTNANGQNNGTVAIVKTNNSVGNLTNPVTLNSNKVAELTSTQPAGVVAKRLRVFFEIPARAAAGDTLTIRNDNIADTVIYSHTGTAAVNHLTNGLTKDLTSVSWSLFWNMYMYADYQAAVVSAPQTSIRIDAWCLEVDYSI